MPTASAAARRHDATLWSNIWSTVTSGGPMVIPLGDERTGRDLTPYVVFGLIALNALVWLLQLSLGDNFTNGYATVPFEITHGQDLVGTQTITAGGQSIAIPEAPGHAHLPHPAHSDVHARGLDAHPRQHALPVDLRRQDREPAGPRPLPLLLSGVRIGRERGPDSGRPRQRGALARRLRRDRGGPGRLPASSSRGTGCECWWRAGESPSCPPWWCSGCGSCCSW